MTEAEKCKRKIAYETFEAANFFANAGGLKLYAYKCPVCSKYHMTKRFHNARSQQIFRDRETAQRRKAKLP